MDDTAPLNLIEIFASVQGETSFAGLPTTFVRLAACNLRCSWCDTTYSFGRGKPWTKAEILDKVKSYGLPYVCVTGGEPLLQSGCLDFMTTLCNEGFRVSLETGGSLSTEQVDSRVSVILDIKCPGSGMSDKNLWDNLTRLKPQDEVKFVLKDYDDYAYAKEIAVRFNLFDKVRNVLLSPVHGVLNPQDLVRWILEDKLPVRLNLQIHKFIWTPETQGV